MAQAMTNEIYTFNAVICLQLANAPTAENLRQVLDFLQGHHPLLAVHIVEEKKRYYFEPGGTPPIPIQQLKRQGEDHWQQIVEDELNTKFDMFTGPLCRVTLLSAGEANSELIITFRHSIMDAVGVASLVQEMLSLCEKLETPGVSLGEPEPMVLLPAAEDLYPPAFKGWKGKWRSFRFMMRQMADEMRYRRGSKGKRQAPIYEAGKNKILPLTLSAEITTALVKESRRRRVTLNSVITAAMLKSVHKHLYQGESRPLRAIGTADLRPFLKPSIGTGYFGSYYAMMMYGVDMNKERPLWEIAKELNDTTYASLKRGDKYLANLMSSQMMQTLFRFKSFRMSTIAISITPPLMLSETFGTITVRDVHASVSNFVLGPEFCALSRFYSNRITWDFLYLDSEMDKSKAQTLGNEVISLLSECVTTSSNK